MKRSLQVFAAALLIAMLAQAENQPSSAPLPPELRNSGFQSGFAEVNGTRLHYVRGGTGPAIVLLHGFPEDWYEFRGVMPRLAKRFTVVAVDLRGVGESAPASGGYDAAHLADDVHDLVGSLGLQHAYVFGHDVGGMVAYAYVRRYPQSTRGAMILDVGFPGLDPWPEIVQHPSFWHVRFHQTDLPEKLVSGRQTDYFRYFLNGFGDADIKHYAQAYRNPGHLRAAFETYRAFPENAKFFAAQQEKLNVPIVIGSGERDAFAEFLPRIAEAMRTHGCANLTVETVKGAAHYVAEEKPDDVAALIERYAREPH